MLIVPTDRLFYNLYWWEINFTWIWYIFVHYLLRNNVFFFFLYFGSYNLYIFWNIYNGRAIACLFYKDDELKKKIHIVLYVFKLWKFDRHTIEFLYFILYNIRTMCTFLFYNGTIFCTFFFFFFINFYIILIAIKRTNFS